VDGAVAGTPTVNLPSKGSVEQGHFRGFCATQHRSRLTSLPDRLRPRLALVIPQAPDAIGLSHHPTERGSSSLNRTSSTGDQSVKPLA